MLVYAPRCVYFPYELVTGGLLTYMDLGVLAVLLSGCVDGGYRSLALRAGCGQEACRKALNNLVKARLVYRFKTSLNGKTKTLMLVSPIPLTLEQVLEYLKRRLGEDMEVECLTMENKQTLVDGVDYLKIDEAG